MCTIISATVLSQIRSTLTSQHSRQNEPQTRRRAAARRLRGHPMGRSAQHVAQPRGLAVLAQRTQGEGEDPGDVHAGVLLRHERSKTRRLKGQQKRLVAKWRAGEPSEREARTNTIDVSTMASGAPSHAGRRKKKGSEAYRQSLTRSPTVDM